MRYRSPLAEQPATKFVSNVSQKPTKRRQWLLDSSAEHSMELLGEHQRSQNDTTKHKLSPTSAIECAAFNQLYERRCMLREDIAGRLIKRVQLISEREQIELAVEAQVLGETHRSSLKLVECSRRASQIKEALFQYGLQRKRLEEGRQMLEVELTEHHQLLDALDRKQHEVSVEEKQRQADCEYRILEFADKHSLLKVVKQFLLQYREAPAGRREAIRQQFVRFQKSILSANRAQEIERLTDDLRVNYARISKEYNPVYASIEQTRSQIRKLQETRLEEIKGLERQLLSVKVNEEIGYNELAEARKDQQACQFSSEQIIEGKTAKIFLEYCEEHAAAFEKLEQRYGGNFGKRMLEEAKSKFYQILREQTLNQAQQSASLADRLKLLAELVDHNTQTVEKQLIPQLAKLAPSRKTSNTLIKDSLTNFQQREQQNHLSLEDRMDSAYEYVETESKSYSRELPRSLGKRSLDRKKLRMSVDDRFSRTKQLFKCNRRIDVVRKDSLKHNEERLLTDAIEVRTTTEHSIGQKTVVIGGPSEAGQLMAIIRQLQTQASVWKKSYATAPTFQLEGNLEKMGYAGRLLSLSHEINLEFRVGKEPNHRSASLKLSKVDQTIQLQRVRRLEKVRSGLCFTLCLDRGVLDIVFRIEDDFLLWFNGLTNLMRNRSLLSRLRQHL